MTSEALSGLLSIYIDALILWLWRLPQGQAGQEWNENTFVVDRASNEWRNKTETEKLC